MKSYSLNEVELRWVLSEIYEYEWGCPDRIIKQFDEALADYRARLLTGYNKPKSEDTI